MFGIEVDCVDILLLIIIISPKYTKTQLGQCQYYFSAFDWRRNNFLFDRKETGATVGNGRFRFKKKKNIMHIIS